MKITLRSIDSNKVPSIPALKENRNLEPTTKGDTLTYTELDNNFGNLLIYLKDLSENLGAISGSIDTTEIKQNLSNLKNKVDLLISKIDQTKDIDKPISQAMQDALNLKIDISNIKTVNGESLVGSGDVKYEATKEQVVNHITSLGSGERGTYALFGTQNLVNYGDNVPGSQLTTEGGLNPTGTWRCVGSIDATKAFFLRIV